MVALGSVSSLDVTLGSERSITSPVSLSTRGSLLSVVSMGVSLGVITSPVNVSILSSVPCCCISASVGFSGIPPDGTGI